MKDWQIVTHNWIEYIYQKDVEINNTDLSPTPVEWYDWQLLHNNK